MFSDQYLSYCVALLLAGLIALFTSRHRRHEKSPPLVHIGIPIIGNYIEFSRNPIAFLNTCHKRYGSAFTVPLFHKRLTFLIGPEVSAPFFRLGDDVMNQSEVYKFMIPVFGKGIIYDAPQRMRTQQMQRMASGLRSKSLISYVPKMEQETLNYLQQLGTEGEVNLLDMLSELTIMTASRCLHGDEIRESMFEDVARIYHDLDRGVTPFSVFFPYAPTAAHRNRDRARTEMVQIFEKIMQDRRDKGTIESDDILQHLMDFEYKEGGKLTDDQIVGLLIGLLFAGQHTSSITSTWAAMFLIHHERCMELVIKEQNAIIPISSNSRGTLDFDLIAKMDYLQNCVKEALRLHPPLIMLMRTAMQDFETTNNGEKIYISKGDICVTSPQIAGRLGTVFENPNAFMPERFNEPLSPLQQAAFSYIAFGGGMHACMGQQFGLLQVKTILSVLFRSFKFEPINRNQFPEPDYTAMVVGPKGDLIVKYKKRNC